jgi:hypothetical protein
MEIEQNKPTDSGEIREMVRGRTKAMVGGPLGGMIGYAAGNSVNSSSKKYSATAHTSEFETNLLLLASKVIKADGRVAQEELDFVRSFFTQHFSEIISMRRSPYSATAWRILRHPQGLRRDTHHCQTLHPRSDRALSL